MTLTALSLTPSARNWLSHTKTARVLNAFDRACNLINQDNIMLAIVTSERGLTPFAMLVASDHPTPFQTLSTESTVSLEGGCLRVGSLRIDCTTAALCDPRPEWLAVRRAFASAPAALDNMIAVAASLGKAGSLLDLLEPPVEPSPAQRAFLARARLGATALVHGLVKRSLEMDLAGAKALAGLGNGLTPAGDDFIVGVMLAAWAGLYGPDAEALCPPIAEVAAGHTTALSAAYLHAAARGECTAQWHRLFDAICRDQQGLRLAIGDLLAVGHTSGADALAGFLATHYLVPEDSIHNIKFRS